MATYDGNSYIDPRNINLKGGASGSGILRWDPINPAGNWASNPLGATAYGLYINTSGQLVFASAGSTTILGGSGGTGPTPSFNQIFAASQTMSVQGTQFTIQDTTGTTNNVLNLVASSTSGALLNFAQSGSGVDVSGTSASWTVSKAGAATFLSVTSATYTGSGAVTLSANGSSAITIGSGSNTVTIAVATTFSSSITGVNGIFTSTSNSVAPVIVTDNTMTTMGHAAASLGGIVMRSTSVTTGTLIKAQSAEATLTTGFYFEAWDTTASATVFSVAKTGAVNILGSDGNTVLTIQNGDIVCSGASSLTMSDNDNGGTFSITNNTATTANTFLFTGSGVFTGSTTSSFFNLTQSGLTTGTAMTITTAALTTGIALGITATAQTTGGLLTITGGGANITAGGALIVGTMGAAIAGNGLTVTTTGAYTGTGLLLLTANSQTTGTVAAIAANGTTTGHGLTITSTGVITTTGDMLAVTANSATTSTGVVRISGSGLTSGTLVSITGGGVNQTSAGTTVLITSGASTDGVTLQVTSTGAYTGTVGILAVTGSNTTGNGIVTTQAALTTGSGFLMAVNALTTGKAISVTHTTSVIASGGTLLSLSSTSVDTASTSGALVNLSSTASTAGTQVLGTFSALTTGIGASIVAAAMTTGVGIKVTATAATLTTGFYFAANDGALNTFTVGANGHITSNQTTAPTIATNSTGLSAVAVTAGSTDTCGTITSTGTPAGGTVITLTFNKTYTTAPKVVLYAPANAAAGGVNTMPIITQTATTAIFTWPSGGVYAATPSWTYTVIA